MEFEQDAFVALVSTFSEMSVFVDPSLTVLRAYGPTYKFTGRDADQIEGQELYSLFTPDSTKQLTVLINPMRARVQKAVGSDDTSSLEQDGLHVKNLSLFCPSGPLLVEVKITPRRDTVMGGGAYYYMVVFNDLSYTKDLEKKKNSFFATMNHELRTPLNGIIGLTESLRSGEKEKARKKHFDMMLNSAQCMLKLINNILDTASMKNNVADLDLSLVRVNHVAEEVVAMMSTAVDKRGRKLKKDSVELTCELGESLPAIDLDKEKVSQAIEALVNNGLKFTHKGYVTVKTCLDPSNSGVLISVEDTGIGISPDSIDRIFDSFEQEDDDHENRKFEGLGLGLTLAKEIVTLHGGKLWVESEVGTGSKFFISLPPNVRALKLISEKQRSSAGNFNSNLSGDSSGSNPTAAMSQEEKDRMELIRVKHTEQLDVMQREVFAAMKAISHLTVDLELFEDKYKAYSADSWALTDFRRSRGAGGSSSDPSRSDLSVASHFLSGKMRSYELPQAQGLGGLGSSRLHRNFGVGTNFVYNNF